MGRQTDNRILLVLSPSAVLAGYFHLLHGILLLICLLGSIPLLLGIGTALVIGVSWWTGRLILGRGIQHFQRAVWTANGEWRLLDSRDMTWRNLPLHGAFCTNWLIVLNFRSGFRKSGHIILLPGMVDGETLRRLRIRLRGLGKRSDV